METTIEAAVYKDLANKKITVTKHFDAKLQRVWDAWTKKEILDQWWAPKPWRAETKKLDFREGGTWEYAMVGPNEERQYAKVEFTRIDVPVSFEGTDAFADEHGKINSDLPQTHWKNEFKSSGDGTDLIVTLTAKKASDLEKLLETGFEEGFKMGLANLDEYLERHPAK